MFTEKVRHMEDAGAAVGILVDNTNEDVDKLIMVNDGNGYGIRTPSIMIGKSDGEKILKFLNTANQTEIDQMVISIFFDISNPDNRVEYDIWLSSSNDKALDFVQDFGRVDEMFRKHVLMTPHYKFQKCTQCDKQYKNENCLADGKYCSTDSSHKTLSGRQIIEEDLRELCIYNMYYEKESTRHVWWDYMKFIH